MPTRCEILQTKCNWSSIIFWESLTIEEPVLMPDINTSYWIFLKYVLQLHFNKSILDCNHIPITIWPYIVFLEADPLWEFVETKLLFWSVYFIRSYWGDMVPYNRYNRLHVQMLLISFYGNNVISEY